MISRLERPSVVRLAGVGAGARAVAQSADGDHVEGAVGLAVAAEVEPVAVVRPEEAGIGAAPQSVAKAASLAQPVDVLAGGDQQLAGVLRATTPSRRWCAGRRRRRAGSSCSSSTPISWSSSRTRLGDGCAARAWPPAAARAGELVSGRRRRQRVALPSAYGARRSSPRSSSGAVITQVVELVEGGGAGLDRAVAGHASAGGSPRRCRSSAWEPRSPRRSVPPARRARRRAGRSCPRR